MTLQSLLHPDDTGKPAFLTDANMQTSQLFVSQTQEAVSRQLLRQDRQPTHRSTLSHIIEAFHQLEDDLERDQPEALGPSLSRLFFFGVWIAECYGVILRNAYSKMGIASSISALIDGPMDSCPPAVSGTLTERARDLLLEIVRNIEFYKSHHQSVEPENLRPLGCVIPEFHWILAQIGRQYQADLVTSLDGLLRGSLQDELPNTDRSPAHAMSVRSFEPLKNRSYCPFAGKARLWGAQPFQAHLSLAGNVRRSVDTIVEFARVARREELDGFVFAFPNACFGESMNSLSAMLETVLTTLKLNDPDSDADPRIVDVKSADWRFSFFKEDFFVPVFAPIYGQSHPRYTFEAEDQVFVLLQPNGSFHRRMTGDKAKLRKEIKSRFTEGLQPYGVDVRIEAERFLPPRNDEDAFPHWYEIKGEMERS